MRFLQRLGRLFFQCGPIQSIWMTDGTHKSSFLINLYLKCYAQTNIKKSITFKLNNFYVYLINNFLKVYLFQILLSHFIYRFLGVLCCFIVSQFFNFLLLFFHYLCFSKVFWSLFGFDYFFILRIFLLHTYILIY